MTTPESTPDAAQEPGPQPPGPPVPRRLLRSRDDRVLTGVAGGLGRWLDLDPVIFRVTFAVLTLFGGVGLVCYLIGYLLIPDEATGVALISSRFVPDPRRLTPQQRTLIGWIVAGILVIGSVADHRSTTFVVLGIVLAVIALTARGPIIRPATGSGFPPRPMPGPASAYQAPQQYAYTAPQGTTVAGSAVPPSAAFTRPAATTGAPQYLVRSRGRRLNRVVISAGLLAIGVYLLAGHAGGYDATVLQAAAVGLTAVGAGLVATAWRARSRVALVLGALLTVFVLAGSAVQGDYGDAVGYRTWRPAQAAAIPYEYRLAAGSATLDLTQLGSAAVGHTIRVSMGAGKLAVRVPDGLLVSVYGDVQLGSLWVFDQRFGGDPVRETVTSTGWTPADGVRIIAQLRVGNVEVDRG